LGRHEVGDGGPGVGHGLADFEMLSCLALRQPTVSHLTFGIEFPSGSTGTPARRSASLAAVAAPRCGSPPCARPGRAAPTEPRGTQTMGQNRIGDTRQNGSEFNRR